MKLLYKYALTTLLVIPVSAKNDNDQSDWNNIKAEMHKEFAVAQEMLQETMSMFGTAFGSITHDLQGKNPTPESLMIKSSDDGLEIIAQVPDVQDSSLIEAFDCQEKLEVTVPQHNKLTTLIIDENSITMVTNSTMQQKNRSGNNAHYQYASESKTTSEMLPFTVNLKKRSIEYDNDVIRIKLSKQSMGPKAQPRIIPVTNK